MRVNFEKHSKSRYHFFPGSGSVLMICNRLCREKEVIGVQTSDFFFGRKKKQGQCCASYLGMQGLEHRRTEVIIHDYKVALRHQFLAKSYSESKERHWHSHIYICGIYSFGGRKCRRG